MNTKFKVRDKIKHIEYGGKIIDSIVDEVLIAENGEMGYHATPIEGQNDKLIGYIVKEKNIIL